MPSPHTSGSTLWLLPPRTGELRSGPADVLRSRLSDDGLLELFRQAGGQLLKILDAFSASGYANAGFLRQEQREELAENVRGPEIQFFTSSSAHHEQPFR